ncbi:MAG TPA: alpha/beta fold hydrolase [Euzebyales bacterium]|nr:alpha/beta fold hydrolase [Euzebyales bacterium]
MRTMARGWSVRRQQIARVAVRAGVGALQAAAPPAAGAVAERLWFRPPRLPAEVRDRHGPVPASADQITVRLGDRDLHGFTLGEGPPALLVHGWGGWAGQFGALGGALADAGFTASALDLPGHGRDRVRRSDLFQMAAALRGLADLQGAPSLVVSHSLGAMAAVLAFDDPPPPAAVFIAPALSTAPALSGFSTLLGLRPVTTRDLEARLRRFVGDAWPRINQGAALEWPHGPLLVAHDRQDPQTPFATSAALAARRGDTDLLVAVGTGHHRVVRDAAVVAAIVDFARRRAGGHAGGENVRNAAGLDTMIRSSRSSPP